LGLWDAALLFAREALGGAIYGGILGYAAHLLMRSIDDYATEIMLTLAVVTGGYALAQYLHVSGPIAMVVAGLMVGQQTRQYAMSETTRHHLDAFWETIDHILNAILFVLIGLEAIVLKFPPQAILLAALAIPVVLLSRWISVVLPIQIMHSRYRFIPYTVRMLTWGGLRGGISIALALSLPAFEQRDLILAMTYGVVIFSILVQGLTVGPLAEKIARVENKS
jgi:monovalent cation:H+ antiporter, CPA1 family